MRLIEKEKTLLTLILTGKRGDGKTLFMTWLSYMAYQAGWDVYNNYDLFFPSTKIRYSDFHKTIPDDGRPKLVSIDDLATGHRRDVHEAELNRLITLARKLISERCILVFSTPLMRQYNPTIIEYTDYNITPIKLLVDADEDGKPALLVVSVCPKSMVNPGTFINPFSPDAQWLPLDVSQVCDLYATKEAPATLRSGNYRRAWDIFNEWAGAKKPGLIAFLSQAMQDRFGWPESECKKYAKNIKFGHDPYAVGGGDRVRDWIMGGDSVQAPLDGY